MSPQRFEDSEVDHGISGNFFFSPLLSHEETNELDVGVIEGHGESREKDGDSEYVAVVPEAEFGQFERSHDELDALVLGEDDNQGDEEAHNQSDA